MISYRNTLAVIELLKSRDSDNPRIQERIRILEEKLAEEAKAHATANQKSYTEDLSAKITKSAVKVLPIFDLIAKEGNVPERDMYNTYNMGVGMSIVVPCDEVEKALSILTECGESAYVIGEIVESEEKIVIC